MRRLLRAVARGEQISQDVSTLENPAIIDQLRGVESPARRAVKSSRPRARARPAAKKKAARPGRKSKRAGARAVAKANVAGKKRSGVRRKAPAARRTRRRASASR
jgi:hypothetical protein